MVTRPPDDSAPGLDARLDAEAAAWLARLRGPRRTEATERGLRAWLATDPAHAAAFSRATEVWDLIGGAGAQLDRSLGSRRTGMARWPMAMAAGLALVACLIGGGVLFTGGPAYRTQVGEQQSVILSDGTRLTLNTDSRVRVRYSAGLRRVELDQGEAMFEVAKNPARPFVVVAAGDEVRALGTVFVVRRDQARLAVTLVEGRVSVSEPGKAGRRVLAVLTPGQRLTVRPEAGSGIDHPRIEAVTAWRRGQVMFDDVSLLDAAEELNRYGGRRIVVGDPSLGAMKISGVFSTSDPGAFAAAAAQLLDLSVRSDDGRVVLERADARG